MKPNLVAGVVLVVAMFSSIGCSDSEELLPGHESASTSEPATSPIPPVENPRDISVMVRRACDLLTRQQATGFGLTQSPEQSDFVFGTTRCRWTGVDGNESIFRRVGIGMFTNNPTLETAYMKRASWPFFELTSIDGYPVTVTRSNLDQPICDIDVKTAERQSFTLTYDSDELGARPQEACEAARRVASAVLTNLPPKG